MLMEDMINLSEEQKSSVLSLKLEKKYQIIFMIKKKKMVFKNWLDRIYLNRLGEFFVEKGVSAKTPTPPIKLNVDEFLELGTFNLPAYLYNVDDVSFRLEDNRRYTMRDIGNIENRVEIYFYTLHWYSVWVI